MFILLSIGNNFDGLSMILGAKTNLTLISSLTTTRFLNSQAFLLFATGLLAVVRIAKK
jgi:hypothetical protein